MYEKIHEKCVTVLQVVEQIKRNVYFRKEQIQNSFKINQRK